MIVIDLLVEHFPQIVDLEFTAKMEKQFDDFADGQESWVKAIGDFYTPFHERIEEKTNDLSRSDVMKERSLGTDPKTGLEVIARNGRFGPFVQLGPVTDEIKPKRASLEKHQALETITLADAMHLLVLPRTLGAHPNGYEIVANTGRFGPYLKCGEMNISMPEGMDPKTITLEQAIELCTTGVEKKIKQMTPIADLGEDPETKGKILVKDGRFGPYVTDGKTNVTIKKDVDPLTVTREMAVEMLIKKRKAPKRKFTRKPKETTEA
jgi:DNA topoisomerase-1